MSLLAWFPFNGTIENQGLSDVFISSIGTATASSEGLFGQCYQFNGTGYMTLSSNVMDYIKDTPWSIGCWFNSTGCAEGQTSCGLISLSYYATLMLRSNGNLWGRLRDVKTNSFVNITSGTNYFDGKWHCFYLTYDGFSTGYLYADGSLIGSVSAVFNLPQTNSGANIGNEMNNFEQKANGLMNDVRIYNHCLSPDEIKIISQGLIVHFPLKQLDRQRNLLLNSGQEVTNNKYQLSNHVPKTPLETGKTYTLTICVTPASGVNRLSAYLSKGYRCQVNFPISHGQKQILSASFTCTYASGREPTVDASYADVALYRFPNDGTVTENSTLHWIMVEEGTQSSTSLWTPAWEDSDSWFQTTEYDTSGYGYHGSTDKNISPSLYGGSPKYSGCYKFGEGGHIQFPLPYSTKKIHQCTISFWVKLDSTKNTYQTIFIPYDSPTGGLWISINTESCGLWACINANNPKYHKTDDVLNVNQWYHVVFSFNYGTSKFYLNGVCQSAVTWTDPFITFETENCSVGDSYTGTSWNGGTFEGYLSDFRWYATTLSDSDILDLYHTRVTIANNGAIVISGEVTE